jgi:hypothetical protein
MNCPNCTKVIPTGSVFCPECGYKLSGSSPASQTGFSGTREQSQANLVYPKNPPLSPHLTWINLIFPGIPQLVYGQTFKGIVIAVAFFASIPTGIGPLLILIAAIIDGYMVGNTLKNGKPVGQWQFFPN